jgi:hypothetical protein
MSQFEQVVCHLREELLLEYLQIPEVDHGTHQLLRAIGERHSS